MLQSLSALCFGVVISSVVIHDVSTFHCDFLSLVDKVTKAFQENGDKEKREFLSPGTVCPQAAALNSVT